MLPAVLSSRLGTCILFSSGITTMKTQSHDLKWLEKLLQSKHRHKSCQDSNNGSFRRPVFERIMYDFPASVQGTVRALDFCFPSLFPSSFLVTPTPCSMHCTPLLHWPLCFTMMRTLKVSCSHGAPQNTQMPLGSWSDSWKEHPENTSLGFL